MSATIVDELVAVLGYKLEGTENLNRFQYGLDKTANKASRFANRVGGLLGGVVSTFSGKKILDSLADITKGSADLSGALAEVQIVAGATQEEIAAIRPEIRQIAYDTIQGTDKVAASLKDLVAKGLDFRPALEALPAIGKGATAAGAAIEDMTATAAAMMQNLDVQAGNVQRSLDILTVEGNKGAFELADMAREFPTLTAQMGLLGQKGEDAVATLGAALQIVRRGAGTSAEAATNLNNLLQKIASPQTIKKLEKNFGIDLPAALKKWRDEGKNTFEEFIKLIAKITDGGDLVKIGDIFEDMQVKQALAPLLAGMKDYEEIKKEALNSLDASAKQFTERVVSDPRLRWQQVGIQITNLKDRIGTGLLPTMEKATNYAGAIVDKITNWADANKELATGITLTISSIGALLLILGPLGIALNGVALLFGFLGSTAGGIKSLFMLAGGARAASSAFNLLKLTLLGLPIGWVIAAIIALAAIIYKFWGPIKSFFSGFWDGLTDGLGSVKTSFSSTFEPILSILQPVINVLKQLLNGIKDLIEPMDSTSQEAQDMGRIVGQVFAELIQLPARLIAALMNIPKTLASIGASFFNAGREWGANLVKGLSETTSSIGNWIKGKLPSWAGGSASNTKEKTTDQAQKVVADTQAKNLANNLAKTGGASSVSSTLNDQRQDNRQTHTTVNTTVNQTVNQASSAPRQAANATAAAVNGAVANQRTQIETEPSF